MMLRRRLEKNGQKIMWSTIVDLYNHQKNKNLRLCPKLNLQSVFLNGYSKLKVKYVACVLSRSVAQMLEDLKWENTAETVNFIRKTNDFLDMLNGAHSQQGHRSRNENLNPYCSTSDHRFGALEGFLNYLQEWRADAEAKGFTNITVDTSTQDAAPDHQDVDDPFDPNDEELVQEDPASVRQLPLQTVEGIQITVRGFIGAVKFLLCAGTRFINARVFCQDPLEQYFSKQMSKCGGSTNPNQYQVQVNQRLIHMANDMACASHSGNTEVQKTSKAKALSDEPLPKRRKTKNVFDFHTNE
ncbi:Relaxin-3 [Frankliniella fusca]|uniref:Relaxin-3 n=1 Tax=Frankliniella fusca TaxID=407009 RepID=A0AAE1HVN5_9NEOP|nr:Relaxin-3 [Frankliniella fusca]